MFKLVSQKRLDKLQEEYNELSLRLDNCREVETKNKRQQEEIFSLTSQLKAFRFQIREQTEADLFFISAKIQKKLLDGEPKENVQDLRLQQITYPQMLGQQQQQFSQPSFVDGLGLGRLSIFGNRGF